MTFTALSTTIGLICGCIVGSGVTVAWEWGHLRKVHRRYCRRKDGEA